MNQKARYEQLITEKLDGLPVPGMADAIWARIETQLDIDMPADNGPEPPTNPPGITPGLIGGIGLLVIAALLTVFIARRSMHHKPPVLPQTAPATSLPSGQPGMPEQSSAQRKTPVAVTPQKTNAGKPPDNSIDAAVAQPLQPTAGTGNAEVAEPPVLPPLTTPVDTPPPAKKQRGVPIDEDEYRIVPKKRDST